MKKIFFLGIMFLFISISAGCSDSNSPTAPALSVSLSTNINSGKPPLTVIFTAEPSAAVVSYEWDFVGDGTYDGNTSGNTATYTYNFNAVYKAKVRVTDANGNMATAISVVNVASY